MAIKGNTITYYDNMIVFDKKVCIIQLAVYFNCPEHHEISRSQHKLGPYWPKHSWFVRVGVKLLWQIIPLVLVELLFKISHIPCHPLYTDIITLDHFVFCNNTLILDYLRRVCF